MTSIVLLRTCFISACAYTLLNQRDSRLLNLHRATVVAKRTTRLTAPPPWRYRLRRRRTSLLAYHLNFPRKPPHSFNPYNQEQQQQPPSQNHNAMEEPIAEASSAHNLRRHLSGRRRANRSGSPDETKPRRIPDEIMSTPPPTQTDDLIENRSSRSASSASRSTNRLSLTLPIAPPSPHPSRPPPMSTTTATFPPTPLDTPALLSPIDSTDFITAIAAQERRVLELKEDLSRAEADLANLKKQYANYEAYKKKGARRNGSRSQIAATVPHDEVAIRRSVELDRRKALLGQQNQQTAPEKSRRRVFTGGHTRTLSLLSPTKPSGGFDEPEDATNSRISYDSLSPRQYAPVTPSLLAKRASWAPRTTQQTGGVKQIAQDLKSGIWTFMEDLRQATVGDEPITGQGMYLRGSDGNMRSTMSEFGDQDTIRASSHAPRPRATTAFEDPPTPEVNTDTRSGNSGQSDNSANNSKPIQPLRRSKTTSDATKATKRFSWQPLPADSIDDNDWSNWDSPSITSPTSRWSGTTINGDIIPAAPEKLDDAETTPLKKELSRSSSQFTFSSSSTADPNNNKLEDLFPQVLNQFTPSNIKKTANKLLNEWEKSLSPPEYVTANAANKVKGT
ncbi:hypothetical protein QBC38DRAFT_40890 [Podospora fimiseda]|uniref:DUF4048 domain-containing protein n=1 Tax=Podospora fimiseda TaxID=252190 RepID=A0AAN7H6J8_9PEZI|nr:hypothetical protein QBC38DRAFT_40890 [Podospora fimiseda]